MKDKLKNKMNRYRAIFIGMITALALFAFMPLIADSEANSIALEKPKIEELNLTPYFCGVSSTSFTECNLINYLKEINMRFPEVVLAQAKLESGNFSSNLFKTNNNIFGMKKAYKRPYTAIKDSLGYAYFKDWKSCVIDYALYQSHYLSKYVTRKAYINALGRVYAEDPKYSRKISSIVLQVEDNFY